MAEVTASGGGAGVCTLACGSGRVGVSVSVGVLGCATWCFAADAAGPVGRLLPSSMSTSAATTLSEATAASRARRRRAGQARAEVAPGVAA